MKRFGLVKKRYRKSRINYLYTVSEIITALEISLAELYLNETSGTSTNNPVDQQLLQNLIDNLKLEYSIKEAISLDIFDLLCKDQSISDGELMLKYSAIWDLNCGFEEELWNQMRKP